MKIPFVDLKAQYESIRGEIDPAIGRILETTRFVGGEKLQEFESAFAHYVGAGFGVGTSSGTTALHVALEALGIGRGDEVITACNTFIATTAAISHSGAAPVLVDVLPDTLNIDPQKVEEAITPRTRAIIPVHLYGQSADMEALHAVADRHGITIVSDAAQAHGAEFKGSRRGIHGKVSCYSFYPGKNLGAYGDAGMVVTDDETLAARVRMLIDHGRDGKYNHRSEGFNYRLDTLQAAILDVKLRHLDEWTELRRSRAKRYDEAFAEGPVRPVREAPDCRHVYHLYVVRTPEREKLLTQLEVRHIACGIHYPLPLHLQEAYKHLGLERGDFPVAEQASDEILSLPMYPELTDEMVDAVTSSVKEILA
ncbi:MAG: DegT/DnrJ/EryC1/StrS family aminotransferase [Candidatus Krumholzibacteriia bacterium]